MPRDQTSAAKSGRCSRRDLELVCFRTSSEVTAPNQSEVLIRGRVVLSKQAQPPPSLFIISKHNFAFRLLEQQQPVKANAAMLVDARTSHFQKVSYESDHSDRMDWLFSGLPHTSLGIYGSFRRSVLPSIQYMTR